MHCARKALQVHFVFCYCNSCSKWKLPIIHSSKVWKLQNKYHVNRLNRQRFHDSIRTEVDQKENRWPFSSRSIWRVGSSQWLEFQTSSPCFNSQRTSYCPGNLVPKQHQLYAGLEPRTSGWGQDYHDHKDQLKRCKDKNRCIICPIYL